STKVSLPSPTLCERGHYEAEDSWNVQLGVCAKDRKSPWLCAYSIQRRKRSAPWVPPKPNEFDMAYSISALRAWLGTRSMPAVSGSGFSRLTVGGRIWSRNARAELPASSPPAPPSRWPVIDLVELTAILRSPKKLRMACASSASPIGVDVPWALTYPTTSGVTPASRTALRMTRKPPSCSGAGWVMW